MALSNVSGTALAAGNLSEIVDPESPVASAIPLKVSAIAHGAHSASISNLTEVFTSIATGRPSLRAGSNRHCFTVARADSSKLGVPLDANNLSDSTRPSTPIRNRRVTFPCKPAARASSG